LFVEAGLRVCQNNASKAKKLQTTDMTLYINGLDRLSFALRDKDDPELFKLGDRD